MNIGIVTGDALEDVEKFSVVLTTQDERLEISNTMQQFISLKMAVSSPLMSHLISSLHCNLKSSVLVVNFQAFSLVETY